jgi:hypothetical protein
MKQYADPGIMPIFDGTSAPEAVTAVMDAA